MADDFDSINTNWDPDFAITAGVAEREKAIFSRTSMLKVDYDAKQEYSDRDWINGSLMRGSISGVQPDGSIADYFDTIDIKNRFYSSAHTKFTDASFGGDYAINPVPQFTRYADTRVKGPIASRVDVDVMNGDGISSFKPTAVSPGLGIYYSEAIHDSAQQIHMRFGVPEFNSLTNFFTHFYNDQAAQLARTGRIEPGFFQKLGQVAGMVVNVLFWPLLILHAVGAGYKFLFGKPVSRFYNMKPTMPTYWNCVNVLVNQIGTYRGLYPAKMAGQEPQKIGSDTPATEVVGALNAAMPDVFSKEGGIDVYSAVLRAQRMKREYDKTMHDILNSSSDFTGFVKEFDKAKLGSEAPAIKLGPKDRLTNWITTQWGKGNETENLEKSLRISEKGAPPPELPGDVIEYLELLKDDGAMFATFRVENTGSVSESFSNTVVESDLASKFNSTVAQNKSAYFTFAGGNITDALGGMIGAARDFMGGVLDSFGASGLMSLAGNAFVDIPKHWENSMAQMPKSNYTLKLISPYGNTISQMTNIVVPLCMILAAALPKQAGKQSYTWPFLVEYYDSGRAQTRLGIIDSVSVTRGITNLGFNKDNTFMSAEVSFSILDLSSVVSMPIISAFSIDPRQGITDDENLFSDYMNILASTKLQDQVYFFNKMRLRVADRMKRYQNLFSAVNKASFLGALPGINQLDIFYKGTERD